MNLQIRNTICWIFQTANVYWLVASQYDYPASPGVLQHERLPLNLRTPVSGCGYCGGMNTQVLLLCYCDGHRHHSRRNTPVELDPVDPV